LLVTRLIKLLTILNRDVIVLNNKENILKEYFEDLSNNLSIKERIHRNIKLQII